MRVRIQYKNPGWGLKEYAAIATVAFSLGAGVTYHRLQHVPQGHYEQMQEEIEQDGAEQDAPAPTTDNPNQIIFVAGGKQYLLGGKAAIPAQGYRPSAPQRIEAAHPHRGSEVDPARISNKSLDQVLKLADGKLENMPYHGIVHEGSERWARKYHLEHLIPEVEKLAYAKMAQESRFNEKAGSPRSALGLMQVLYTQEIDAARPILARQHQAEYNRELKEYNRLLKQYHAQRRQPGTGRKQSPPMQQPHKPMLKPVTADEINDYLLARKPHLTDPRKNIPDGIHYIVDALYYGEKKICQTTKPHAHTPAVAEQIRQTAMADYNAGRGYLERGRKAEEWKNRKSRFKGVFSIASILKRLPQETRKYVPIVEGNYRKINLFLHR